MTINRNTSQNNAITANISDLVISDYSINDYCNNVTNGEWKNSWINYTNNIWWLEGVGILFIAVYGVLLNTIAIIFLVFTELASSFFNILLAWLAIFDNLFLLASTLYHVPHSFELDLIYSLWYTTVCAYILVPLMRILMCCLIYMTIVLSLDRYNAVSNPTNYRFNNYRLKKFSLCNPCRNVAKFVGTVVLIAIAFSIPSFFETTITERMAMDCDNMELEWDNVVNCSRSPIYTINESNFRKNKHFILWYVNIDNFLINFATPFVLLVYLNVQTYKRARLFIQRQTTYRRDHSSFTPSVRQRQGDVQQAMASFGIVMSFVLCHSIRVYLNVYEWMNINEHDTKIENAKDCVATSVKLFSNVPSVSHFLLQLNGSANFVIYFVYNKTFRDVVWSKFYSIIAPLRGTSRNVDEAAVTNSEGPLEENAIELNQLESGDGHNQNLNEE